MRLIVGPAALAATLLAIGCGVSSSGDGDIETVQSGAQSLAPKLDATKVAKLVHPFNRKEKLEQLGRKAPAEKRVPLKEHLKEKKAQTAKTHAASGDLYTALTPHLEYLDGEVLERPEVYVIAWGKEIPEATRKKIGDYLRAEVGNGSPTMAMLSEYNTPTQKIGFGDFKGVVVDEDPPKPEYLSEWNIEAEINRLIDLGKLPTNKNGRKLFMVYFPPSALPEGACTYFCGYHDNFIRNGRDLYFAVLPDMGTNGCEVGCGYHQDPLDNLLSVSSHEMFEAVTDPGPSAALNGWYDWGFGEISDICQFFPDGQERGYPVSRQWSNAGDSCRTHASASSMKLTATAVGTSSSLWFDGATIPVGGQATFSITATGGPGDVATLDAMSPYFNGLHFAFSQSTIHAGETVTVAVTADPGSVSTWWPFQITALDQHGDYHLQQASVFLEGPPPSISSIDVTTGPGQGGTIIHIKGQNFSDLAWVTIDGATPYSIEWVRDWNNGGAFVGNELIVGTGAHAVGPVDITVTNVDGTSATLANAFTYTPADPLHLTGLYPGSPSTVSVAGGDELCFEGDAIAFATDPNDAWLSPIATVNGQPVTISWVDPGDPTIPGSSNMCFITNPAPQSGPADLTVTVLDGQTATLQHAFDYVPVGVTTAPAPVILNLETYGHDAGDDHGDDAAYVTIFGIFDAAATVKFGNAPAKVLSHSPLEPHSFIGSIGVIAPKHKKGVVDITVTNSDGQTATLPAGYTY
jgi:hypothetical protein